MPFKEGGGVTVQNSYKISNEEHEALLKLAHTYYEANTDEKEVS